MNRKLWICLLAIFLFQSIFVCLAIAEDETASASCISTSLDLAYVNKFVWRGIPFNEDPEFQPSLTLAHPSGFSLNLWSNIDTTNIFDNKGEVSEIDYTLDYAWNAMGHEINAGIVNYTYPNGSATYTAEAYATMCFGGKYTPSLSVNYDFVDVDGWYARLGTSYDCPMPWSKKSPPVGLSASISWGSANHNRAYYGADKSAFTDVLLSASVPFTISPKVTISPMISYSTIIDSSLRDAMSTAGLSNDNFFTGITASIAL